MISTGSILLRLPANLDSKQALFLDGMRHAAEIASLSYLRLREVLTQIALGTHTGVQFPFQQTSAFLDAWALVDAMDRFRQLDLLFPQAAPRNERPLLDSFLTSTEGVRQIRNVADHLAQRADYVVAKQGAALGILSWYTAVSANEGLACALVPGRSQDGEFPIVNPAGKTIEPPSCMIELSAGEYTVNLSEIYDLLAKRVAHLEYKLRQGLEAQFKDLPLAAGGSDTLIRMNMAFEPIVEQSVAERHTQ